MYKYLRNTACSTYWHMFTHPRLQLKNPVFATSHHAIVVLKLEEY